MRPKLFFSNLKMRVREIPNFDKQNIMNYLFLVHMMISFITHQNIIIIVALMENNFEVGKYVQIKYIVTS